MLHDLSRILGLWRARMGWLGIGIVFAVLALGSSVALMTMAGVSVTVGLGTAAVTAPFALRAFGVARVVLRYLDRLITHGAMFRALADKAINIQVISTSEIKVSVLIAADYTELAVRALHTAYGLDAA